MNCDSIFRLKLATIWSIPRIFQVSNTLNVTQLTHQINLIRPYHLMYHFHTTCLYRSRHSALMCQIRVHIHNVITILLRSKDVICNYFKKYRI